MIEPLARGIDPVQLAFQSLVSMGTRTQRAESPLAVALDRLGVDLARGEPFTTAEAKQFVSLVQATLEVFETATAVPVAPPAAGAGAPPTQSSGALLDTAQFAMRDLQRALSQVLTEHRQVTTSLAPILRALLVAVAVETLAPEPRPMVPARLFPLVENPRHSADVREAPPTLARLVSSLVESIARLQVVLPLDAVPLAEGQAAAEHAAPAALPAGVAEHASMATALPPATTRLLQTLVETLAEVATLLPLADGGGARGGPLAAQPAPAAQPTESLLRALKEAVNLLHDVLPAAATAAPIEPTGIPSAAARQPAAAQPSPLASAARPGGAVAQVIRLVHELLIPNPAAESATSAVELPRLPVRQTEPSRMSAGHADGARLPAPADVDASRAPAASQADASRLTVASRAASVEASEPGRTEGGPRLAGAPPPVAAALAALPPALAASLVALVANLKTALPPAGATDDAAALVTTTLLAELEAATLINPGLAGTSLSLSAQVATVDAYRWGLLVGLNYRPAFGRPVQAPISSNAPRCETCGRLLVQTRSGALVCPTC